MEETFSTVSTTNSVRWCARRGVRPVCSLEPAPARPAPLPGGSATRSIPAMAGTLVAGAPHGRDLLDGLDGERRAVVCAPRGPVCVLAGAGTGKTRGITRRIAQLLHTGQVGGGQVLAVTFSTRAAGEMRT